MKNSLVFVRVRWLLGTMRLIEENKTIQNQGYRLEFASLPKHEY
jgi:hypothetical protein